MIGISLIIPFFNEERILKETLEETWIFLEGLGSPFELLLGDDGSTDMSSRIAHDFELRHHSQCRLFRNPQNRGRGSILTKAFRDAKMSIVAYIDADLEISLRHLGELIRQFSDPQVMICTGSKLVSPQPGLRARHRKCASFAYNFLVQRILHSPISDHQCGLKAFRKETIDQLLPLSQEKGWAWDTEILLLAQQQGLIVREVPVELQSRRKSTVPFFATVFMFLKKIVEFRMRGLAL